MIPAVPVSTLSVILRVATHSSIFFIILVQNSSLQLLPDLQLGISQESYLLSVLGKEAAPACVLLFGLGINCWS